MIQELANSFKAILYDRIVSPLSGAFIFSWLVVNWKLPLVILGSNSPVTERIDYIDKNLLNTNTLLYYPIFSTLFIVIIYLWLSNIAYLLWQYANSVKLKIRLKFEDSSPLTLKQSIELRKEIQRKDLDFNELLRGKSEKISELEELNKLLNDMLNNRPKEKKENEEWLREFNDQFKNSNYVNNEFDDVIDASLGSRNNSLDADALRYFSGLGIIDYDPQNKIVKLSDKGRYFAELWIKNKS